jgi:4-hydroxy-tetrahydrodipicolinate synthase
MIRDALFAGINAAVLTPLRADLSPDLDKMAAHCRWLLARGCNGLGILGTTGEANSIGIAERIALMEGLAERGVPVSRLLPGTGTPALTDTVLLTDTALRLGCRGVLVLPPFFYKNPSEDGLFAYFSELIQRTAGTVAVYLYNFPQQSAVPFTLPLIARLLRAYPGVVRGAKDSSGDFAHSSAMAREFAAEGFEVYVGYDDGLRDILRAGGAGCITAAANVNSAVGARVYAGWNLPDGEAAQHVLTATRRAVVTVPLIPGLKALMARHTGDASWHNTRPPHLPLGEAEQRSLFAAFDACGEVLGPAA